MGVTFLQGVSSEESVEDALEDSDEDWFTVDSRRAARKRSELLSGWHCPVYNYGICVCIYACVCVCL